MTSDNGFAEILQGDGTTSPMFADLSGRTVRLAARVVRCRGSPPYHVDRSKFVSSPSASTGRRGSLTAGRIARAIEYTRFPYTSSLER